MPQSLSKVYVHIVFSTKHRQVFIDENIEEKLFAYLGAACKGQGCKPIRVGGYLDHVHILCTLSRTITQAKLLEEIKKTSSKWMKEQGESYEDFYWQDGYGIFSVNPKEIDVVENYIKNQKTHHQTKGYKEELLQFLNSYNVDYNEKYLWD